MVGTIQPRQYFPISRVLADPSDATVYFVRAVIRNARTGATIDTVTLTSLGSGIWAFSWQAPADPSGQGLFITVTTIVYTNAGFTTLSDTYGQEQDTFLIYDQFKMVAGLANQINALSSGADIDYKKVTKIVETVVAKLLKPVEMAVSALSALITAIEIPEQKETNLAGVLEGLAAVGEALKPLNDLKNTDLSSVMSLITDAHAAIGKIEIPPQKETNLKPVLDAIGGIKIPQQVDHQTIVDALLPVLHERFKEIVTPEFMDKFVKEGMSSEMLNNIMSRSQEKQKPATPYKKVGNRFTRSI